MRQAMPPALAVPLLALLLGRALGQPPQSIPSLQLHAAIAQVDQRLRQQGWQADGDPNLESFDRELAGNDLASLRSCSGTGAGFCRYDYRLGRQRLTVITVPDRNGDGLVHQWQLNGDGRLHP